MSIAICTPKFLHPDLHVLAANVAITQNPANEPSSLLAAMSFAPLLPSHLAVFTGKRWRPGTQITVGFMEQVDPSLRDRILLYMRRWSSRANIGFVYSQMNPMLRVTLAGNGYWSYIGTDILLVPGNQPNFCLQGWRLDMPESEWLRVVPHEAGHALGSPHEHARPRIVDLLDPAKTTAYFSATQGWSAQMIREQILTPLDESQLMGTDPNPDSIMCYQFPGDCTRDGRPIVGGADITETDYAFMGSVYPWSTPTPTPTPPPTPTPTPTPPPIVIPPRARIVVGHPAAHTMIPGTGQPAVFGLEITSAETLRLSIAIEGIGSREPVVQLEREGGGMISLVVHQGKTSVHFTPGIFYISVYNPYPRLLGKAWVKAVKIA